MNRFSVVMGITVLSSVLVTGCAGNQPVTRVIGAETFEIVPADEMRKRQEKSNVIMEDQGEVENLIQSVSPSLPSYEPR